MVIAQRRFARQASSSSTANTPVATAAKEKANSKKMKKQEKMAESMQEAVQLARKKDLQEANKLANSVKDPLMAKMLKRSIDAYTKVAGDVNEPKKPRKHSFDMFE